jgi:hypothetical protein
LPLQDKLYNEMIGYLKEDDEEVSILIVLLDNILSGL